MSTDYVEVNGVRYPIKVNKNGEHYYNVGFFVYRLPWLDKPKCPDPHNCKSWIEALSDVCKDCKFRR